MRRSHREIPEIDRSDVLPIHLACQLGRGLTINAFRTIIKAYPQSVLKAEPITKLFPIHILCITNASIECIFECAMKGRETVYMSCAEGNYPLHYACQYSTDPLVITLLYHMFPGAVSVKNEKSLTPIDLLKRRRLSTSLIQDTLRNCFGSKRDIEKAKLEIQTQLDCLDEENKEKLHNETHAQDVLRPEVLHNSYWGAPYDPPPPIQPPYFLAQNPHHNAVYVLQNINQALGGVQQPINPSTVHIVNVATPSIVPHQRFINYMDAINCRVSAKCPSPHQPYDYDEAREKSHEWKSSYSSTFHVNMFRPRAPSTQNNSRNNLSRTSVASRRLLQTVMMSDSSPSQGNTSTNTELLGGASSSKQGTADQEPNVSSTSSSDQAKPSHEADLLTNHDNSTEEVSSVNETVAHPSNSILHGVSTCDAGYLMRIECCPAYCPKDIKSILATLFSETELLFNPFSLKTVDLLSRNLALIYRVYAASSLRPQCLRIVLSAEQHAYLYGLPCSNSSYRPLILSDDQMHEFHIQPHDTPDPLNFLPPPPLNRPIIKTQKNVIPLPLPSRVSQQTQEAKQEPAQGEGQGQEEEQEHPSNQDASISTQLSTDGGSTETEINPFMQECFIVYPLKGNYSIAALPNHSISNMPMISQAGFNNGSLQQTGFNPAALSQAGQAGQAAINAAILQQAGQSGQAGQAAFNAAMLQQAAINAALLQQAGQAGQAGLNATMLQQAAFNAGTLSQAGTLPLSGQAGQAGLNFATLQQSGSNAAMIQQAAFNAASLQQSALNAATLQQAGQAEVSAGTLHQSGPSISNSMSFASQNSHGPL